MTYADRNYLMPAQEKLEWVTPNISLMDAGDTSGNKTANCAEGLYFDPGRNGGSCVDAGNQNYGVS